MDWKTWCPYPGRTDKQPGSVDRPTHNAPNLNAPARMRGSHVQEHGLPTRQADDHLPGASNMGPQCGMAKTGAGKIGGKC